MSESVMKKFAVSYTIDYEHRVVVGVTAPDANAAIAIASQAFDEGSIWDNTPEMPLLFDDYEEKDGESLAYTAEEIAEFPEIDASVKHINAKQFAFYACQALLAGEIESARCFAKQALPTFKEVSPDATYISSELAPYDICGSLGMLSDEPVTETAWSVKSDNGCDPFEVVAAGISDARRDALFAIGWTVSLKNQDGSGSHLSGNFSCEHCGRSYDDATECLSDDCPSNQLISSTDVLRLVEHHDLQLSHFVEGKIQSRHVLGLCLNGQYTFRVNDGEIMRITANEFLFTYPISLGDVWHVDKKAKVMILNALANAYRNFLVKILHVTSFTPLAYLR